MHHWHQCNAAEGKKKKFSLFGGLCVLFIKWVGLISATLVSFSSMLILGVFDSCS